MRLRPRTLALAVGALFLLLTSPLAWLAGKRLYARFEDRLSVAADSDSSVGTLAVGEILPALARADQWLNAGAAPFDSLAAHPTIVLLWNDTRPSCLRVLPRVQAWHDAYARYGVRVVGVYEPEFAFAADSATVSASAQRLHLTFPIALDPSLSLAARYGATTVLPRLVLFDRTGQAHEQSDASDVASMERAIRRELQSFHPDVHFLSDPIANGGGPRAASAAHDDTAPPTVYLGTSRVRSGPLANAEPGRAQLFTAQFRYQMEGALYAPYPVGLWKPTSEGVTAARGGAENFVALRYDAGPLGAVMSPPSGTSTQVWILRDEHWLTSDELGADARLDGRGASYVEVDAPKLYELCRDSGGDHVVKLSPDKPGLTVHAITFEPIGETPRP